MIPSKRGYFSSLTLMVAVSLVACFPPQMRPSLSVSASGPDWLATPPARSSARSGARREYAGTNLSGWEVVLGDGVYAAPGEPPVNSGDIETVHYADCSKLRANILVRKIMAHNITFKRIIDDGALDYVHLSRYQFKLPYQPSRSNPGLNGETIEGHLSIWDGAQTRLEYLVAFQWIVNPWAENYGDIRVWDPPGVWTRVGTMDPDTQWDVWHAVEMELDVRGGRSRLAINGVPYPSSLVSLSHPDWGDEIAARLAAEIISLYPGEGNGALHEACFGNWTWSWTSRKVYLPAVMRATRSRDGRLSLRID